MIRFKSIVMSETEPVPYQGILWLKKKKSSLSSKDSDIETSLGYDIWWFSPNGWRPLLDLDTRYEYENTTITENSSSTPITIDQTNFSETGIVKVNTTYSIYDGSRTIDNNTNLVNETGLKKHVDDLQSQITTLSNKVSTLESKVSTLESKVSTLESSLSALETTVNTNSTDIKSNAASISTVHSYLTKVDDRLQRVERILEEPE